MSKWEHTELKHVLGDKGYIRGPFGSSLKRDEMQTHGIPVYEQKNAIYSDRTFRFFIDEQKFKELSRFQVKTNDLIISCSGTVGKISIIRNEDPKGIISQALLILRPDVHKIELLYLYYFLSSRQGFELLTQVSHGSVQINIAERKVVENIPILLPPLPEQKAIARVLSSLDDKIDLLNRQNKTLEAMAEALFRQWFVESPNKDWEEKPLSEIADFLNGLACQKHPPQNDVEKLPVLKIKELSGGISDSSDWSTSDIDEKYIVNAGDIIFAWSASLMVKLWDGERCILNQHLFKVTSTKFPKWFCLMWCKHHLDEFIAISSSHATTMGHIKRGDLDNAMVLIPPTKELNKMSNIMNPIMEKTITNCLQLISLTKLRDTLLPKLMSGEVRVGEEKQ